jgi:hypothetical protein
MYNKRYREFFVLSVALLFIPGCAGFMDSVKSGMSSTTNYFKASAAESKGDAAYENKDYDGALAAYRTAAEADGAYGQFMLANMYLAGEGIKRDPQQYLHWMRRSAENGYPPANYLMGRAYLPSDATTAVRYFEAAARDEHGVSMHMLGLMYASGTGVEQSDLEALRWFRLAKAQGVRVDQRFLSVSGIQAYHREVNRGAAQARRNALARQKLVREIQQILTDLGYEPGPVDGLYGSKTRAAIQAFQRDNALEPNGLATAQVLEKLKKAL